jgi:hypothetical protein
MTPPATPPERALKILLRVNGFITLLALLAVFMPLDWMHAIHTHLRLGPVPITPIFEYMARTLAALYAIHGGLCFVLATDVRRFGPVITYTATAQLLFALLVFWIDYKVHLPRLWTAIESPAVLIISALTLYLRLRARTRQS